MQTEIGSMIEAGEILEHRSGELADKVTDLQYRRQPELYKRFGSRGVDKTRQDTIYNLRYLSQSVMIQSPQLFSSYIAWLRILLAGYKVTADDLKVNLECILEVVGEEFTPDQAAVFRPFLDQAVTQTALPLDLPDSCLAESELREEAERYTELLLDADRAGASRLVLNLVEQKVPIEEIYLHIFQPAQYEIGRLWQLNRISVAQEHYFTAATQAIMSQLYPYIFTSSRRGYRLVAACVGEELHEIGLRMVSDIFELNGWETFYIGANVPFASVIRTVIERKADVLALSATLTYHVSLVRKLIGEIRVNEAETCRKVKILVGGMPFNIDPELWRSVGADGYAPDARTAIGQAYKLLGSRESAELGEEA